MDSKNNLKALSAIGFSDIIGTGATAFFWFYLASLINPDQYGEIFFYLGIVTIVSSIVLFANQNTITVYLAKKIKVQSTLYFISLSATLVASLVIILWFYRLDVGFVLVGYVINTLAIGELLALTPETINDHADALADVLLGMLQGTGWNRYRPLTDKATATHIIALSHPTAGAEETMQALRDANIVCSVRNGRVRVSLAHFNDESDVQAIVAALIRVVAH